MCIGTVLSINFETIVVIVGLFINVSVLIIGYRSLKLSMSKGLNDRFDKKADKDYVDSNDKTLLSMIKSIKEDNKDEHRTIRTDIQEKLESMDDKLNLLLKANLEKK